MKILLLTALLLVGDKWHDKAKHPDCAGVERWAASMAYVHLKNDGMVTPESVDFEKTKSTRIASQQIGKDLFRQVHLVTFAKKDGETIEVITVNDASNQECSMSGVEVYVVAKKLGSH